MAAKGGKKRPREVKDYSHLHCAHLTTAVGANQVLVAWDNHLRIGDEKTADVQQLEVCELHAPPPHQTPSSSTNPKKKKKRKKGRDAKPPAGPPQAVRLVAPGVAPDRCLTASDDKVLRLWNTSESPWTCVAERVFPKKFATMAVCGDVVFVGDKFGDVYSLSLTLGEPKLLLGHLALLTGLHVVPGPGGKQMQFLVTSDQEGKIRITHYPDHQRIEYILVGHSDVLAMAVLPTKRLIVSGGSDGVRVWHVDTGACVQKLALDDVQESKSLSGVTGVSASTDERLVALTVFPSNQVRLYSVGDNGLEPCLAGGGKAAVLETNGTVAHTVFQGADTLWVSSAEAPAVPFSIKVNGAQCTIAKLSSHPLAGAFPAVSDPKANVLPSSSFLINRLKQADGRARRIAHNGSKQKKHTHKPLSGQQDKAKE